MENRGGVAEHVEEDGLGEGVELGEGGAALGPQRVRLIQDRRNPSLLGEGRERNPKVRDEVLWYAPLSGAASHLPLAVFPNPLLPQKVNEIARVKSVDVRSHDVKLRGAESKAPRGLRLGNLSILEAWRDLRDQHIVGQERRVPPTDFAELPGLGVDSIHLSGVKI
jgi:hypothetical protein